MPEPLAGVVAVDVADETEDRWRVQPRAGLLTPETITLSWPQPLPPALRTELDRGLVLEPEDALTAVTTVAAALREDHEAGHALLTSWGLRWDEELVAVAMPGLTDVASRWSWPYADPPAPGPRRDLYLLAVTLVRLLTGRWPRDRSEAVEVAGVLGGSWPLGADTLVRRCLHPDERQAPATASELLALLPGPHVEPFPAGARLVAALESVTGWQKAQGRVGGDNEDVAIWDRSDEAVVGLLADGVSGTGAGSGLVAAQTLRTEMGRCWQEGERDPARWLQRCHEQLRAVAAERGMEAPGHRPAATAIGFRITADGAVSVACVGDSSAFICRRSPGGPLVTRLTTEDSRLAERLAAGEPVEAGDQGVVTRAVGVHEPLRPHVRREQLQPGDFLVVLSDGASKGYSDDAGAGCWLFEHALEELMTSNPSPALLASLLCRRAEELGGNDNATALVVAILPPEPATRRAEPAWVRRMQAETIT